MKGLPPSKLPPEPDYVAGIEATISELRGAPLVLSTHDWERVRRWRAQGIPLPVVVRALNDVLGGEARAEAELPAVRSLAYCERAVQQRWKSTREAWVGRATTAAAPTRRVRSALHALARQVEGAARKLRSQARAPLVAPLRQLATTLRKLARGFESPCSNFDDLAPSLREAESALHRGLRDALGAEWEVRCTREDEHLRPHLTGMNSNAARTTVEAAALRRLRQELGVPGFDLGSVHARLQAGLRKRRLTAPPSNV